jgi:hypothetical protein
MRRDGKKPDRIRVVHGERRRWGNVVKYAFLNCDHDWIAIIDSDMQFGPV